MKLIRYAAILLFASACSQQPAVQDQRDTAQPAPESATKPAVPEPQKPPTVTERTPPAAPKAAARDDRPVGTDRLNGGRRQSGEYRRDGDGRLQDACRQVPRRPEEGQEGRPPLKETNDPAKIKAAKRASPSRSARSAPTRSRATSSRRRSATSSAGCSCPKLKGEDGRDAKAILKDDAPASVPLKVNANYPEGASLPTVPASIAGEPADAAQGARVPHRRQAPDSARRRSQHHRRLHAERDSLTSQGRDIMRRLSRARAAAHRPRRRGCRRRSCSCRSKTGSVKFAVIGDTGTGDSHQLAVAKQLDAARAKFPFEFAVMMGDNMYGGDNAEGLREEIRGARTSRCSMPASSSTRRSATTTIRTSGSTSRST